MRLRFLRERRGLQLQKLQGVPPSHQVLIKLGLVASLGGCAQAGHPAHHLCAARVVFPT